MGLFFPVNCILLSAEDSREGICKGLDWNLSLLLPLSLSLSPSCLSAPCLDSSFYFSPFWMSFICRVMIAGKGWGQRRGHAKQPLTKTVCWQQKQAEAGSINMAEPAVSCTSLKKSQEISEGNCFISSTVSKELQYYCTTFKSPGIVLLRAHRLIFTDTCVSTNAVKWLMWVSNYTYNIIKLCLLMHHSLSRILMF